jgi:3-oxoacyl-[acyl-carrier-protein] synthase III
VATRLDAVGAAFGKGRRRRGLRLADDAARACLQRAGRGPDDVDLLINAGLYHDRLLGEPALAAIVQDDIDANPEDPHEGGQGTFSFDVANGACGMLTGLQVADGFLRSGTIRHALVVASDANPGRRLAPGFPYPPVGAAILCGWDDGPGGLSDVRFATRPVDGGGVRAVVAWQQRRNRLSIAEEASFLHDAAELATEVAAGCLEEHELSAADVDLIVANPLRPEFLDRLAAGLGVPADRVVRVPERSDTHTAALGVALEDAQRTATWAGARTVLLVSAGAGLVAGAALLRPHA